MANEKKEVSIKESIPEQKIPFSEWEKMRLKVGKILKVDIHPNADKLYVLQVDLGKEKRQIVAGIRLQYKPEELVGKQIVVCTNLQSAVIRGIESHGMLLAADSKGRIIFVTPEKTAESGSTIG